MKSFLSLSLVAVVLSGCAAHQHIPYQLYTPEEVFNRPDYSLIEELPEVDYGSFQEEFPTDPFLEFEGVEGSEI